MGEESRLMNLERFYQNKESLLKSAQNFFQESSNLIPKIGIELEFFLLEKNEPSCVDGALVDDFILQLQQNFEQKNSLIYSVEKEQGVSQVEIKTAFTSDFTRLVDEIELAKKFIMELAQQKNLQASFAAKPIIDDCGSAMQFNISLHNERDENVFASNDELLKRTANLLLQNSNDIMIFLAPQVEDYLRFSSENNRKLFVAGKYTAPVNLSFGADNRTCAIRIPALNVVKNDGRSNGKRLEYRLASAQADVSIALAASLLAMCYEKTQFDAKRFQQIYGNAFDLHYKTEALCIDFSEAEEKFFAPQNQIRQLMQSFLDHGF